MSDKRLTGSRYNHPRRAVYSDDWSDEYGDRSLGISCDDDFLYISVYRQLGGKQEIHLPIADAAAIALALQRVVAAKKA
jgi:hypothetical protein